MPRRRAIKVEDLRAIEWCILTLRAIRDVLKAGGAQQAANYVRRALKSVEGALHHARGSLYDQERRREAAGAILGTEAP